MPLYLRKFVCHSFLYFLWIKPFPYERAMEGVQLATKNTTKKLSLALENSLQPMSDANEKPEMRHENAETDSLTSEEETTLCELWMHLAIVVDRVAFMIYSAASVFTVIYSIFRYPNLETCSETAL